MTALMTAHLADTRGNAAAGTSMQQEERCVVQHVGGAQQVSGCANQAEQQGTEGEGDVP
jgi:hypothetical protein